MKLSAVRVFVHRIADARAFYADVLDLPLRHDGTADGWCVFDAGGADLVIERIAADAPADEQALPGRFTGVSFAVDDIHAAWQRLRERGVAFDGPPERQSWGGWLATFVDADGNRLQLVQKPA